MLRIQVNLQDTGARAGIAAAIRASQAGHELNASMAMAVADGVKSHLRAKNQRASPTSNFYSKAADSVEVAATADTAEVAIPHRGFALRFYGGTVTGGASISDFTGRQTRSQALPTDNVPRNSNGDHVRPKEAAILAFIPNRRGDIHTSGFLVQGVMKAVTRGPNKGKQRPVSLPGGKMMFILRRLTRHRADPTVLPTVANLLRLAGEGARQYIASFEERNGS